MKCLSLKQPYAYLLASGKKTIEIRKWNTKHRGEFLIHSSKNTNDEACSVLRIDKDQLVNGAIIGKGFLYDVKTYATFDEFAKDKEKHFSIEKIVKVFFPPISKDMDFWSKMPHYLATQYHALGN